MAPLDHAAQFQEPVSAPTPTHNASNTLNTPDIATQFQEPISPAVSNDASLAPKSTTEKVMEKVKRPFGHVKEEEVKSPELEAAEEVLRKKGFV